MSFGDFMGLLVAVGGFVGFTAVLVEGYKSRLRHKERMAEMRAGAAALPSGAEASPSMAKIEHRLRVLERIATDKRTALAAEIEDLRESADAR